MIQNLKEIKNNLPQLIIEKAANNEIKTMFIDYHKPYVSRIWFQHGTLRVFLHKIEACNDSSEALYHPHEWNSAMEILRGTYEMGIGHSETNQLPKTDCKLILPAGSIYEMTEKDAWHYVNPIDEPCYTLMITEKLNGREMPIQPNKKFRQLSTSEICDILEVIDFNDSVNFGEIANIITGGIS